MKGKRKGAAAPPPIAFWDTSGIVPLCCFQSQTSQASKAVRIYSRQVTWWATAIEVISSFNRLHRENNLTKEGKEQALARLAYLRKGWNEIQPTDEVRDTAERLLSVHKLRAADALQLSAALAWCRHQPQGRHFIGADGNLATAAEAEGFTMIRLL